MVVDITAVRNIIGVICIFVLSSCQHDHKPVDQVDEVPTNHSHNLSEVSSEIRSLKVQKALLQSLFISKFKPQRNPLRDSILTVLLSCKLDSHLLEMLSSDSSVQSVNNDSLPFFVYLTSPFCKPCKLQKPALQAFIHAYLGSLRFSVIENGGGGIFLDQYRQVVDTVNGEMVRSAKAFRKRISNFPFLLGFPSYYLISPQGKILSVGYGALEPSAGSETQVTADIGSLNSETERAKNRSTEVIKLNYNRFEKMLEDGLGEEFLID